MGKRLLMKNFYEISDSNLELVDDLLDLSKALYKKRKYNQAHKLLKCTDAVLKNNKKLLVLITEVMEL